MLCIENWSEVIVSGQMWSSLQRGNSLNNFDPTLGNIVSVTVTHKDKKKDIFD